jgi:DNA primase
MEITEIKQKLSIHTVLEYYHLEPDKHGRVCCPFHDDKTPSLQIYPKTNTFHCFGCGKTGDTIEFIQQKQVITKHESIMKAASMLNGSEAIRNLASLTSGITKPTVQSLPQLARTCSPCQNINKALRKVGLYCF